MSEAAAKPTNMPEADSAPILRATYRLQFHKEFGFRDAAALAPYFARLGVSHIYASPYLKARPGSTHGYDIVDHGQLNPELGGEPAFDEMVTAFRDNDLGQILVTAFVDGGFEAGILTPVPEPSSMVLPILAIGGVLIRRRLCRTLKPAA